MRFLAVLAALFVSAPAFSAEIDRRPMPIKSALAFAKLRWAEWSYGQDTGKPIDIRAIVLTPAVDGTKRLFAATQRGVIHVFPDDPGVAKTKVFLDITQRVSYDDKQNEEGFLGLAFHPQYKENGQLFVYYTNKQQPHQNVVSRFTVDPSNPDRAEAGTEQQLLVLDKPFWNHDGGTTCFGPDGFLYIAVGDGGAANDPQGNGQKLGTLLGKVLRIDVDKTEGGTKYAIPADNPFKDQPGARGEIYALGLRNIWRMAFDPADGKLWAGDVGQDLWEEIDVIEKGGNYGWNVREGLHPFPLTNSKLSTTPAIDPIYEYHHNLGKSITGGSVYRGKQFPELVGHYIYGDYVAGRAWALKYDFKTKKVVANREIGTPKLPIMSFGEDTSGEIYFMTNSIHAKPFYKLVPSGAVSARAR